jgi:hypothetical protein
MLVPETQRYTYIYSIMSYIYSIMFSSECIAMYNGPYVVLCNVFGLSVE